MLVSYSENPDYAEDASPAASPIGRKGGLRGLKAKKRG